MQKMTLAEFQDHLAEVVSVGFDAETVDVTKQNSDGLAVRFLVDGPSNQVFDVTIIERK